MGDVETESAAIRGFRKIRNWEMFYHMLSQPLSGILDLQQTRSRYAFFQSREPKNWDSKWDSEYFGVWDSRIPSIQALFYDEGELDECSWTTRKNGNLSVHSLGALTKFYQNPENKDSLLNVLSLTDNRVLLYFTLLLERFSGEVSRGKTSDLTRRLQKSGFRQLRIEPRVDDFEDYIIGDLVGRKRKREIELPKNTGDLIRKNPLKEYVSVQISDGVEKISISPEIVDLLYHGQILLKGELEQEIARLDHSFNEEEISDKVKKLFAGIPEDRTEFLSRRDKLMTTLKERYKDPQLVKNMQDVNALLLLNIHEFYEMCESAMDEELERARKICRLTQKSPIESFVEEDEEKKGVILRLPQEFRDDYRAQFGDTFNSGVWEHIFTMLSPIQ